jgi:hypothetical protein
MIWAQNLEAVGLKPNQKKCQKKKNSYECRHDSPTEKILLRAGDRQLFVVHQKAKTGQLTKQDEIQLLETR